MSGNSSASGLLVILHLALSPFLLDLCFDVLYALSEYLFELIFLVDFFCAQSLDLSKALLLSFQDLLKSINQIFESSQLRVDTSVVSTNGSATDKVHRHGATKHGIDTCIRPRCGTTFVHTRLRH